MTAAPRPLQAPPLRPTPPHEQRRPADRAETASHLAFRSDVEGLRGVAILLVVLYHVGLAPFGGGFVGVDVFFVLSGFLITRLLLAELARSGTISFAGFYARRIRRLLPAATVTIAGTLTLVALLQPPGRVAAAATAARGATAFFSNILFSHIAADYFQRSVPPSPLLHTWSLSVEEQFYFVWPALMLLAAGRAADRRRLGWTLAAMVAVSLTLSWYYTIVDRPTAFYGTPMRAWEFALGALVVLVPAGWAWRPGGRPLGRAFVEIATIAGCAMVVVAATQYSDATPFPGLAALLPVVGTALVLVAGSVGAGALVQRALSTSPMQWVGRHSYGWYLWHWPLLVLAPELFPDGGLALRIAAVLAALALAAVTRVVVEDPVRHGRAWRRQPRRVVVAGLAGITTVFLAATALGRAATRASLDPSHRAITAALGDRPALYDQGCASDYGDERVHVCAYGTLVHPAATVAVFGDSHAAYWEPALEAIAGPRRWRVLVLTKKACPSVDMTVYTSVFRRAYTECDAWRRAALDSLRVRQPALVVIANSAEYVAGAPYGAPRASASVADYERGLTRTLAMLHAAHVPALVIQDVPRAAQSVPICLERALWRGRDGHECDFRAADGLHAPVMRATTRAVAQMPDDRVVDVTAALCPAGLCPALRDGLVLYRDDNHVTTRTARRLAPLIEAAIDSAALPAAR